MPIPRVVAVWLSGAFAAGLMTFDGSVSARTPQTVTLTGALQDDRNQPLATWPVQACTATTCFPSQSDARGRFRFELPGAVPVQILLKIPAHTAAGMERAAALWPVWLAGSAAFDVGAVYVPPLGALVPLPAAGRGARSLAAGDGLELTLDRGQLTPAPGTALVGLAAHRIPPAHGPSFSLPAGEQVVAVYALHPAGATSERPIAVRAPATLPAGTRVRFRTVSDLDGRLSDPVPGRATGTHVATEPALGIRQLTYLVISR